jgi:hypothetical protein
LELQQIFLHTYEILNVDAPIHTFPT